TRGAHDEIRLVGGNGWIVAGQRQAVRGREGQRVVQRDRLEDCLDVVVAVGAFAGDAKRPVDLGVRADFHVTTAAARSTDSRAAEVPSGVYAFSSIARGEASSCARKDSVRSPLVARMRIMLRSVAFGSSAVTGVSTPAGRVVRHATARRSRSAAARLNAESVPSAPAAVSRARQSWSGSSRGPWCRDRGSMQPDRARARAWSRRAWPAP